VADVLSDRYASQLKEVTPAACSSTLQKATVKKEEGGNTAVIAG